MWGVGSASRGQGHGAWVVLTGRCGCLRGVQLLGVGLAAVAVNAVALLSELARIDFLTISAWRRGYVFADECVLTNQAQDVHRHCRQSAHQKIGVKLATGQPQNHLFKRKRRNPYSPVTDSRLERSDGVVIAAEK